MACKVIVLLLMADIMTEAVTTDKIKQCTMHIGLLLKLPLSRSYTHKLITYTMAFGRLFVSAAHN